MYTIFIDTHSEKLLIGLLKDEKVLEEVSKKEKSHSEHIMPTIETVLENNGVDVKDINKIISIYL